LGSNAQHNTFLPSTPIIQGAAFRPFFIEDTAALGIAAETYTLAVFLLKGASGNSIFVMLARHFRTEEGSL
jgi:hypothetical protein